MKSSVGSRSSEHVVDRLDASRRAARRGRASARRRSRPCAGTRGRARRRRRTWKTPQPSLLDDVHRPGRVALADDAARRRAPSTSSSPVTSCAERLVREAREARVEAEEVPERRGRARAPRTPARTSGMRRARARRRRSGAGGAPARGCSPARSRSGSSPRAAPPRRRLSPRCSMLSATSSPFARLLDDAGRAGREHVERIGLVAFAHDRRSEGQLELIEAVGDERAHLAAEQPERRQRAPGARRPRGPG